MKRCKNIIKVLAIIIGILLLAALPLRLPLLGIMLTDNSFSFEKEVVNNNIDVFEDTVKIVQRIIDENKNTDRFCISINNSENETSFYLISPEKGLYKLSKDEQKSVSEVDKAFSSINGDYYLDCIRVENGVISFDVIDGSYAVLYTTDSAEKDFKQNFYDQQENIRIKRIKGNWYHKKSGISSFTDILNVLFGTYLLGKLA